MQIIRPILFAAIFSVLLSIAALAHAFDASAVPSGTYYNAINATGQFWTPLFVAQDGHLVAPQTILREKGLRGLVGKGKTENLQVTTAFLTRACDVSLRLATLESVIGVDPSIYIEDIERDNCKSKNDILLENPSLPKELQGYNPVPTVWLNPSRPDLPTGWFYGLQGSLVGKGRIPYPLTRDDLGGSPSHIAAIVSQPTFLPEPIIEPGPGAVPISRSTSRPHPYRISILEIEHRNVGLALTAAKYDQVLLLLKRRLEDQFSARLTTAFGSRFGGVQRKYFELAMVQGIDVDNTKSFDLAGVARVGLELGSGVRRWIDIAWVWRTALGDQPDALQILNTSEGAMLDGAGVFRSEMNYSIASPQLVISAFADFDKDKVTEIVTSLITPVGVAVDLTSGDPTFQEPLNIVQSFVHAWERPSSSARGTWREVFRTRPQEERSLFLDPKLTTVKYFGRGN